MVPLVVELWGTRLRSPDTAYKGKEGHPQGQMVP